MTLTTRLRKVEEKVAERFKGRQDSWALGMALLAEAQSLRQKDAETLTASEQDVLRRAERLTELIQRIKQRKAAGWKPGQQA